MKKFFVVIFFFVLILNFSLLTFSFPVLGEDRYATCDQCGYCPPNSVPSNWESCRACLYESASDDPSSNDTLKINEENNLPPTPMPGRLYTIVGCISTTGSFQQEGAASSLVQKLLDIIFAAAGAIALLYFVYGSFIVLTSQAEPEKINQGKRIIYGAIIGIIVSLSSVFIVNLLASGFLKIPGFE